MIRRRVGAACARALLGAMLAAALAGCTLFDDYLPGAPFTLDQPQAEVTVEGDVQSDPIVTASEGCNPGGTLLWGRARNTGDLDVVDVSITIDVFDGGGALLGSFSGSVFNGTVSGGSGDDDISSFGTDLVVDQLGTFSVCTPVPFGVVARTEYFTEFLVLEGES